MHACVRACMRVCVVEVAIMTVLVVIVVVVVMCTTWTHQRRLVCCACDCALHFHQLDVHVQCVMTCCACAVCTAFSRQRQIVCGACDGGLRVWELHNNQMRECGKHDQAVKCCAVLEKEEGWESSAILSGSWDSTVALWDLRQGATAPLSKWKTRGKVYAMDAVSFQKVAASLHLDRS